MLFDYLQSCEASQPASRQNAASVQTLNQMATFTPSAFSPSAFSQLVRTSLLDTLGGVLGSRGQETSPWALLGWVMGDTCLLHSLSHSTL